ncbi:MAG TPA: thioesterase family protein [Paludibacteraceae bacterium]|nr:thioesterase family protein [Paludibacteraceae bacterium]HQF49691.1 thioesterase family protein [Paludibacteraceae bacterium]
MKLKENRNRPKLIDTIEIQIRFSEVDSIKMAWHGSYVKYMEDGREAFGRKFGLEYMRIFDNGYLAPIVDMHLQYKQPVTIDDIIIIETTYIPSLAAKLMFEYNIYRKSDHALVLKASTIQLFMTKDGAFEISTPPFLAEWRQKWNQ